MAKKIIVVEHLSTEDLKQRYLRCQNIHEARRWQAVWLVKEGRTALEVAQLVGVSDWSVCSWVAKFNADPVDGLSDRRVNNHGRRLLSDEQEAELARLLETERPPDGGLWSGPKVAQLIGSWLGRAVHDQEAWRIMVRLGFRPKRPRPRHPQADAEAQQAFQRGGSRPR